MPCRRYVLYMAWSPGKYRLGISANPQVDLSYLQTTEGYEGMAFISPPLPLALSEYLLTVFSNQQERNGKTYQNLKIPFIKKSKNYPHSILYNKFKQVKAELAKYGDDYIAHEPVVFKNHSGAIIDYFTLHQYEDIVEFILQGKILFLKEIRRLLQEKGLEIDDLEMILHLLTLKGQVVRVPSVKWTANGAVACNRCGQQYRVVKNFCNEGQKECYYCQECLMLGESKPCEALYAAPARMRPEENFVSSVRLNLDISFSQAQYEAFEALARFVRKDSVAECLVWEACGAGRPETVFGALREVLKRGGRVLFGVPRRDVLDDLFSRLERAFPGVSVAVRYGKPRSYPKISDIVLASTHQALKFYHSFDLVILDESDAFPYRANPILINALRRAKKGEGKLIYMTPTPAPDIYARAQCGEIKVIQIPIRQHGHPLVTPQIILEKELVIENKLPERVIQLIRESIEEDQAQVLVVVPNGYYSQRVGELLAMRLELMRIPGLKEPPVIYTGSHDPERDKKVNTYFRGESNILITTGLTGRGDLAPNSNMVVLWSENDIFDEGYLLQLAGRVGWSESYPGGKVWFVSTRVTREMEGAVRKIKLLNEEAQKRGFLDNTKKRYNRVQR